jgi:hypothetical protein
MQGVPQGDIETTAVRCLVTQVMTTKYVSSRECMLRWQLRIVNLQQAAFYRVHDNKWKQTVSKKDTDDEVKLDHNRSDDK